METEPGLEHINISITSQDVTSETLDALTSTLSPSAPEGVLCSPQPMTPTVGADNLEHTPPVGTNSSAGPVLELSSINNDTPTMNTDTLEHHNDPTTEEDGKSQENKEAVEQPSIEKIEVLYRKLLELFPNADHAFLRRQCETSVDDEDAMNIFISKALEHHNYPTHADDVKRKEAIGGLDRASYEKIDNQYKKLLDLIPNAEHEYLWKQCKTMVGDEDAIDKFISKALEHHNYPRQVDLVKSKKEIEGVERALYEKIDTEYQNLLDVIPNVDQEYLWNQCKEMVDNADAINEFMFQALKLHNYPKQAEYVIPEDDMEGVNWALREKIGAQYLHLVQLLPDADPDYLLEQCIEIAGDEDDLKDFVTEALDSLKYPTREQHIKHRKADALRKKFLEPFRVEFFLKIFDDPWDYFLKEKTNNKKTSSLGMQYLERRYEYLEPGEIETYYQSNNFSLAQTCKQLDAAHTKKPGRNEEILRGITDIDLPFVQEVAFIENEAIIREYLETKANEKKVAFARAQKAGELKECGCCYADQFLLEDMATCYNDHLFCKECIRRGAEVQIGDGKTTFPCLGGGEEEFSLKVLQEVLKPKVFSSLLQRKQLEEAKAAGISELESCPFCDFTTLPAQHDAVFRCLNAECMKDSCRKCKESDHVPLRCNEVEKSEEIRMRKAIEDAMTRALIRKCYRCQREFIKEAGCNKMTCSCGAMQCYICRLAITGYEHFHQGTCPLSSTDQDVHVAPVIAEAQRVRERELAANPGLELKHDPTKILP